MVKYFKIDCSKENSWKNRISYLNIKLYLSSTLLHGNYLKALIWCMCLFEVRVYLNVRDQVGCLPLTTFYLIFGNRICHWMWSYQLSSKWLSSELPLHPPNLTFPSASYRRLLLSGYLWLLGIELRYLGTYQAFSH